MSYNIDSWEQIACSLTFPASALDSDNAAIDDVEYGKPGERTEATIQLDCGDGEIKGVLVGDVFTVVEMHARSEGSGRMMEHLEEFLSFAQGAYTALLVWEGGDSITLLSVQDGAVTNEGLNIPALLRENADLKERLAALEKQGEEL